MKCRICKTEFFEQDENVLSIKASKRYSYIFCPHCELGMLVPCPTKREFEKIYAVDTYFENLSAPAKNRVVQWFFTRKLYQSPSEWLINTFSPRKILDVGCGNGEFLSDLQKNGWDVWGTDVSSIAMKRTEQKIGKGRVKAGDFLKQKYTQKFDVISFWHILEHIENPTDYLAKAYSLLTPNGVIAGEMPNGNSAVLRRFTYAYSWHMFPDHILYYTEKSLRYACNSAGFSRQTITYPPRALLNFSLSYKKLMQTKKIPANLQLLLFVVSIPLSLGLGIINAWFKKGEVIRFIAYKI